MSESKDLSILPPALSPAVVFAPGGVEDILRQIREKVANVTKDISTPAGRAEIKSAAYNVARSKTALDEMGKELVAELKAKTGAIDAERKKIRDELDALKDEVRRPLTEWEEAEKSRVAAHEEAIEELRTLALMDTTNANVSDIDAQIAKLETFRAREWEEFKTRFEGHYEYVSETLSGFRTAIVKREEERAEFERLRKEEEARKQREREEQIAREAAEKARREAEEAAAKAAKEQAAKEEAERRRIQEEAEARERAERLAREKAEKEAAEKLAAEQRERERAEREKRDAVAKAEKARIEGHQRALESIRGLAADGASPFNDAPLVRHIIDLFEKMEELNRDWEEFADEATATIAKGRAKLAERLRIATENEKKRAEQAEIDRLAREKEANDAAVERERQRVAAQEAKEKAEAEARERDKKHKAKVNNAALSQMISAISGVHSGNRDEAEAICKEIIKAIALGDIPHVKIFY